MTAKERKEITRIAKEFASGIGKINNSGWFIVDPLSAYLSSVGYENTLSQLPATESNPQVLMMQFNDGSILIPAGGDLKTLNPSAKNWMWITLPLSA